MGQTLSVDMSTDMSVDIPTDISTDISWSIYRPSVSRHISRVPVDISTDISFEYQSICRPTYRSSDGRHINRYIGRGVHTIHMIQATTRRLVLFLFLGAILEYSPIAVLVCEFWGDGVGVGIAYDKKHAQLGVVHGVVHGPGPWGGPWTRSTGVVHVLYTSGWMVHKPEIIVLGLPILAFIPYVQVHLAT